MRELISVDIKNKSAILKCAPHIFKLIREKFSVPNPSFQTRRFAPRKYIITPSGAFEVGLWVEIRHYISTMKIPVEVKLSPEFIQHFSPAFPAYEIQNIDGFTYYDHQKNTIEEFLKNGRGLGILATSAGKCLGAGTKILMYDGTIQNVENIKVGDLVMGPDSYPRKVECLTSGTSQLYKISNKNDNKGRVDSFVVNDKHILSFKLTNIGNRKTKINNIYYTYGDIININVEDYIQLSPHYKHILKAWKPENINWESQDRNNKIINDQYIDPYFLGLWLGDGNCSSMGITTMDDEISEYIINYSNSFNLGIRIEHKANGKASTYFMSNLRENKQNADTSSYHINYESYNHLTLKGQRTNKIWNRIKKLNLKNNKHIPLIYKTSNRDDRLKILAGLIDTDGYFDSKKCGYQITQKNKQLAEDIVFVCNSLGLSANIRKIKKKSQKNTEGIYYNINIHGKIYDIPCKLPRKKCPPFISTRIPTQQGIKVEDAGIGEYYGFELSGNDHLFLLGDFTVTHNSLIMAGLIKTVLHYNPKFKILIIVPNTSLVNQMYHSFIDEYNMPVIDRWGDGYVPNWESNVIIANSQILISDIKYTVSMVKDFDMVVVDEVHRLGEKKNQINKVVHNITTPHKFGLTGTLPDNYMASWNIIGKIGPILYEETSYNIRQKGVAAEVEIKVILCRHTTEPEKTVKTALSLPTDKYNNERVFLYRHVTRNNIIKRIAEKTTGNTLILVDVIEHGEYLEKLLADIPNKTVYFVQGSMETDDRANIIEIMEQNNNIICIAMSQIFSTGISINNLPFVIFSCIGKSLIKISQSIGRTMRLHENKDKSIIYDIADDTEYSFDHLKKRLKIYKDIKILFEIKKITI